jgi:anaphase-promoting complex subunit 8
LIFHIYCSQELYQATEDSHQTLTELETIFPQSSFLKTQRALLYYHSKGPSDLLVIAYGLPFTD